MSIPSRICAVALLAASLGGCQGGGGNLLGNLMGGGGVMPDSEVGLPPSMRGTLPNSRQRTAANVDDDGNPLPANPTRQLALPKNAGGQARGADGGPRRLNREDLAGGNGVAGSGGGAGGLTPSMAGSGVGVGGKF